MKSCFLCVVCLFLVLTAISAALGCDLGETKCVRLSGYREKQYATCVTDSDMRRKSGGSHACESYSSYCYYQCMLKEHHIDEGPVYSDCECSDAPSFNGNHGALKCMVSCLLAAMAFLRYYT